MNDAPTISHRRARYMRLIALRDRVDRIAARAKVRIHAGEPSEFWRGVKDATE